MKILQINTTVNSGSTGRIAEDIGSVLIANGHESYIAYGRGNKSSQSKLIKIGNQLDVNWHGVITLLMDRHGFGSKNATVKLIKEIDRIKPDVIGLHNLHGYYLNIQILFNYIKNKNIPLIWTFHDCWSFTGHCTYFDSVDCEKWKTICQKCPKTLAYPKSFGIDNSTKNFNDKKQIFNQVNKLQIVTPSIWLKQKVEESFLNTFPIICINNGIDLDQFKPISNFELQGNKRLYKDKKIILGVASIWDKRKGLLDFMNLSYQISNEYIVVLIGLSEKQINQLPENIIGITRTENVYELASYYSIAHVFVNPTYQDNFPTTNIEALACGTPVITYKTGGSPESIDQNTGYVVEKGDVNGIIEKLELLKGLKYEEISRACRERAEKLYDKKTRFLDYLRVFEEMVNK